MNIHSLSALPIQEVVGLFRDGDCPPSSRCELARSDAWYIYFDSEEDAQKVSLTQYRAFFILSLSPCSSNA